MVLSFSFQAKLKKICGNLSPQDPDVGNFTKEAITAYAEQSSLPLEEADFKPRWVNSITDFTGDDTIMCTDSKLAGVIDLMAAEQLGVKISRKDVGISHIVGNYAEEWILTPPTKEAHFIETNNFYQGEGIPYVIDSVKVKNTSPVRKQSLMDDDLDLPSKFRNLGAAAKWTDPRWFTYNDNQLAMMFGCVLFDLRGADVFPFLMKEDGGLSGFPPWGNVDTFWMAAWHFSRGKSLESIYGLARDATLIKAGKMNPTESELLKNSHRVQKGKASMLNVIEVAETLAQMGMSDVNISDIYASMTDTEIPTGLREKGFIVKPDDMAYGSAIARLKALGLILSENGVYARLHAHERKESVYGTEPIGNLIRTQREKEAVQKARPQAFFEQIVNSNPELRKSVMDNYEAVSYDDRKRLIQKYLEISWTQSSIWTSFSYSEMRIYPTAEVDKFLNSQDRKALLISLGIYQEYEFRDSLMNDEPESIRAKKWLEELQKGTPLSKTFIPYGMGVDDARIYNNLKVAVELERTRGIEPRDIGIILISSDRGLQAVIRSAGSRIGIKKVVTLSVKEYFSFAAKARKKTAKGLYQPIKQMREEQREFFPLPPEIRDKLAQGSILRAFIPFYDVPNVNKTLFHVQRLYGNFIRERGRILPRNLPIWEIPNLDPKGVRTRLKRVEHEVFAPAPRIHSMWNGFF